MRLSVSFGVCLMLLMFLGGGVGFAGFVEFLVFWFGVSLHNIVFLPSGMLAGWVCWLSCRDFGGWVIGIWFCGWGLWYMVVMVAFLDLDGWGFTFACLVFRWFCGRWWFCGSSRRWVWFDLGGFRVFGGIV